MVEEESQEEQREALGDGDHEGPRCGGDEAQREYLGGVPVGDEAHGNVDEYVEEPRDRCEEADLDEAHPELVLEGEEEDGEEHRVDVDGEVS